MKIVDISKAVNATTEKDVIFELKSKRHIPQPDVDRARKSLDPKLHDINDHTKRKDKWVKVDVDNLNDDGNVTNVTSGGEKTAMRQEPVARVALALQPLIIDRAVSFLFGNPVHYKSNAANEKQNEIAKAFKKVLNGVKINSLDRRIARTIFGFTECAEYWYPVGNADGDNRNIYGFPSPFKLKCAIWSPEFGDTLYPYFDATGDMVAFSREYTRSEDAAKGVTYFETFTDEEHCLWRSGEMVEGYPKRIAIGKIPVIFGFQRQRETQNVDSLIDRLETLMSNFADTNDYHAAPKIFTTGVINGWSKKGESGAVIEGEEGATMNYVSWQSAPESVKLEIETLLRFVYTITQTPDISFDSVKGLNVSGIALRLMFMDAHLKVHNKREIFDDYLQRRANIIKAYLGEMNQSWKSEIESLDIMPEITPYMLTSDIDEINKWLASNGNKPLISHKESVMRADLSPDPEADFKQIEKEQEHENYFEMGEPVDA